jgi:hypothetical protein
MGCAVACTYLVAKLQEVEMVAGRDHQTLVFACWALDLGHAP